jgi:hypothetical protein
MYGTAQAKLATQSTEAMKRSNKVYKNASSSNLFSSGKRFIALTSFPSNISLLHCINVFP